MSYEELKPCPFCGGAAIVYSCGGDGYSAECNTRDCSAYTTHPRATEAEAITAWNRRAADDAKQSAGIEAEYPFYWDGTDNSYTVEAWISDEFGSLFPANCPKCGAPMQIVRPGRAECSASCWLDDDDDDDDDDDWHEDDDKRGAGGHVNCRCQVDETDDDLTARIEAVKDRIENLSRGIAEHLNALAVRIKALEDRMEKGNFDILDTRLEWMIDESKKRDMETQARIEALSDRIAKLEKQVVLLRALAAGE